MIAGYELPIFRALWKLLMFLYDLLRDTEFDAKFDVEDRICMTFVAMLAGFLVFFIPAAFIDAPGVHAGDVGFWLFIAWGAAILLPWVSYVIFVLWYVVKLFIPRKITS